MNPRMYMGSWANQKPCGMHVVKIEWQGFRCRRTVSKRVWAGCMEHKVHTLRSWWPRFGGLAEFDLIRRKGQWLLAKNTLRYKGGKCIFVRPVSFVPIYRLSSSMVFALSFLKSGALPSGPMSLVLFWALITLSFLPPGDEVMASWLAPCGEISLPTSPVSSTSWVLNSLFGCFWVLPVYHLSLENPTLPLSSPSLPGCISINV